ncbi:glycosyltransferase [Nocardiopsis lucentensis]|uniref:glycosyltransferase n=1 Tax=Nocardiopsis lucentensis TaxID=53441 RepID=UPI00034524B6|nr:glycosyltransferase [Nocardiopsis lucentensis]
MSRSLLYLLNVSNASRLSADSGWIYADILTRALTDAGCDITLVCPAPVTDPRVRHMVPPPTATSKYRVRVTHDVGYLAQLLRATRPDTIVVNQIEAAPAVRAAMLDAHSTAQVVGYCHYLPFSLDAHGRLVKDPAFSDGGLELPIRLAFASGLAACDRVLVHSRTARDWTLAASDTYRANIHDRVHIVPPPRDPRLVRTDATAPEHALGLYNHRLYGHYGTDHFIDLARRVTANGLLLRVMDLFGRRDPDRVALDPSPEHALARLDAICGVTVCADGGDRDRYRTLLADTTVGFAPFRPGCTWSMSIIDLHVMGVPVIAPRMAWMAEAVHEDLLFDPADLDSAIKIVNRLVEDPAFWQAHSRHAHDSTRNLTPEQVAADYLEAIR